MIISSYEHDSYDYKAHEEHVASVVSWENTPVRRCDRRFQSAQRHEVDVACLGRRFGSIPWLAAQRFRKTMYDPV